MIKDNQKRLNNFHVVLDAIVILLSYALAWYIQIGNPWSGVTAHNKQAMAAVYLIAAVIIVPLYLCLLYTSILPAPDSMTGTLSRYSADWTIRPRSYVALWRNWDISEKRFLISSRREEPGRRTITFINYTMPPG